MPNIYFFSDAHLGIGSKEEETQKERAIIRFLDFVRFHGSELYIVGDLFDYWFEYSTVVPKGYFRLFTKLSELTEAGIHITFIVGNHDAWAGQYFIEELGIEVSRYPIERTIMGKRFLIHHGDGLLKKDTGYHILKRILRNRINIFLYSLLHPDLTGGIARWSSRKSRKYTSNKHYEEDDMVKFAEQKIREGFDYIVMGHNHTSQLRNIGQGRYVNLGDWIINSTYAEFDGEHLLLKQWNTIENESPSAVEEVAVVPERTFKENIRKRKRTLATQRPAARNSQKIRHKRRR
ncbi:MAG: UDP-2,3-diacylglucosamine diphosphatase [bacterium]